MLKYCFQFIVIFFIVSSKLLAQSNYKIYINEFLASNVSIDADIIDFDDYSDWIELYNDEDFDVDISNYFISDNLDNPFKWEIPAGTIIPAKSFLRLWADGYDDIPGRTYRRPYYPFNYFTTAYYHLNFNLSRAGEEIGLYNADSILIDSVSFNLQFHDVSMGRYPDGTENWYYFGEPTAENYNNTQPVLLASFAENPQISLNSGFYNGGQFIDAQSDSAGSHIFYTLDGSKPSSFSDSFATSINISENTVLRARIFNNDKLPGNIITRSFFIDEDMSLPAISIVTPPAALFDNTKGIYENIYKEREIPIHFEYFNPDGVLQFSLDAGLRLTGQMSLYYAQKSFTISARERYGNDVINYQVFNQRELGQYKSLYLRNGGVPDNQSTFFRDALAHTLILNKIDVDCQAYQPAVVFINAGYWGLYNIRDKINADYLASIYNLNPEDIDLLEYASNPNPEVMEGYADNYNAFYNYIDNNDLSVEENYNFVKSWMDIDEYIDYQICEILYDNVFWPDQNMRMWRERKEGKKWRWILFDIDYGLGMPNPQSIGYQNNTLRHATSSKPSNNPPLWSTLIFRKLLENNEFKIRFIQRFASYLNTVFHRETMLATLNQLRDNIDPEMTRHINRWRYEEGYGIPIPDYYIWLDNVEVMEDFIRYRPGYQRNHIIDYFELNGTTRVYVNISDPAMGSILINEVESVKENTQRIYFKDIPILLKAIPNPGYQFVKWTGLIDSLQNPLTISLSEDSLTFIAQFEEININKIPKIISSDTTFTQSASPYYATSDVVVDSGVTVTIESGVEILMPEKGSIYVNGRIIIDGFEEDPVFIKPNEYSDNWGALCFVDGSDSSSLSYVNIIGATKGKDFTRDKAAISCYNSKISINNVIMTDVQMPIFVQYGHIYIRNCYLHSDVSGDLINIKYANYALVEDCELRGNDCFDSDAIDYDQVEEGIIRENRIYNFYGFNSDAIDLGEESVGVLIENNIVYNINDKGVSIGHGSTAIIKRNLISNCDMGIGIKDYDSFGYMEHNTFYSNNYGIACFEKNIGAGGGTAEVVNCIIANSKSSSILVDALSNINISYTLSNTDVLDGLHNIQAEPGFLNNFRLIDGSLAIDMGNPTLPPDPDGSLPDLGAIPFNSLEQYNLFINEIHYNPIEGQDYSFVEIVNAGSEPINLHNYKLAGDINFTFPDEPIGTGEYLVIAKNMTIYGGHGFTVYQWETGSLPIGAGNILLLNDQNQLIDYVNYDNKYWWPTDANGFGPSLELQHVSLENMVSGSWSSSYYYGGSPGSPNNSVAISGIYINEFLASNSSIIEDEFGEYDDWIEIYNSNEWAVNLAGFFITDNLDRPTKYQIPFLSPQETTLPAGGFLLLWADDQTEQGVLHLNFKLDKEGEQIGITQVIENDTIFVDSLTFLEQLTDISFGRYPDGSDNWYQFANPTPLDSNSVLSDIDKPEILSQKFCIFQNYPNPFNLITVISYQLPKTSHVDIDVYNLLGEKVTTIFSGRQLAGTHQVRFDGSNYASGIYFYRIKAGDYQDVKKMLLIK